MKHLDNVELRIKPVFRIAMESGIRTVASISNTLKQGETLLLFLPMLVWFSKASKNEDKHINKMRQKGT